MTYQQLVDGVMICYDEEDLAKATQRILEASDATDNLIIEQKLKR